MCGTQAYTTRYGVSAPYEVDKTSTTLDRAASQTEEHCSDACVWWSCVTTRGPAARIEKPLCTDSKPWWTDGQERLPGLDAGQLASGMANTMKRECTRGKVHEDLQDEGTQLELQKHIRVTKSACPETTVEERGVTNLKGRGVLFLVPLEHKKRWQDTRNERDALEKHKQAGVKSIRFSLPDNGKDRANTRKPEYKFEDLEDALLSGEVRNVTKLGEFSLLYRSMDQDEFVDVDEEDGDLELVECMIATQRDQQVDENEYALFIDEGEGEEA